MMQDQKRVPKLRFPDFTEEWESGKIEDYLARDSVPVDVNPEGIYQEIGVRSHGRGIFHKEPVSGKALGEKRVFWVHPNAFVLNIVFAWEQAVALTSDSESGLIASHRFPMYLPIEGKADLRFVREFFLRARGRYLLSLASPGGAGRNKTLGQSEFAKLNVVSPKILEQGKIAEFLSTVERKIHKLKKKRQLLTSYKRGAAQLIFSQKARFKADDGSAFPAWEKKELRDVAHFSKGKGISKADIHIGGSTKCIRYGELYTTYGEVIEDVVSTTNEPSSELNLSKRDDVIIPASGESALDIAAAACVKEEGVALGSDLNIIRSEMNGEFLAYLLTNYKRHDIARLAQGNSVVHLYASQLGSLMLEIPHICEQKIIANFMLSIDKKVANLEEQISKTESFKEALLQRLFV